MTRSGGLFRDGAIALALVVLVSLLALKMNDQPETIEGESFYAIDGDTLSYRGERLRLLGIDAPEYRQQCGSETMPWPCGRTARDRLGRLLQAGAVACSGSRRDRYGRLLVTCRAGSLDMNGEMVRQGMAVAYGAYRAQEDEARRSRAGIWAGRFEPPEAFRRDERDEDTAAGASFAGLGAFLRELAWSAP